MREQEQSGTMDRNRLYREETFTDQQAGTIRRLTPVTSDGLNDAGRPVVYIGQAQMLTPMGALPLSFEIPATTLADAADKFGQYAQQAAHDTLEELKEMRREQSSSIVLPGSAGGGGKIQLR